MTTGFHTLGDWVETEKTGALTFATDKHGRVLLQLRDDFPHVAAGGQWAIFGGQVEAGEALIEAAVREFQEETGLAIPGDNFHPFARIMTGTDVGLWIYRLDIPVDASQIRLGEGAGFAFLTASQLTDLPLVPAVRQVLDHYFARLSR